MEDVEPPYLDFAGVLCLRIVETICYTAGIEAVTRFRRAAGVIRSYFAANVLTTVTDR